MTWVQSIAHGVHRTALHGLPDAHRGVLELDQHVDVTLQAGVSRPTVLVDLAAGFGRLAWHRLTDGITTGVPGAVMLLAVAVSGFTASHDPRPVGSEPIFHWLLAIGCLPLAYLLMRSPERVPSGPLWSVGALVAGVASLGEGIVVDATFETDWALKFCAIVAGLALIAAALPRDEVFVHAMRALGVTAFGAGLACFATLSYGFDTAEFVSVTMSGASTMLGGWAAFRLQDLPPRRRRRAVRATDRTTEPSGHQVVAGRSMTDYRAVFYEVESAPATVR